MNELQIKILTVCSGRTYKSLSESFGIKEIDFLLKSNFITLLENGTVLRTELGINASKNISSVTNEKFGTDGNQLLLDSEKIDFNNNLLLS